MFRLPELLEIRATLRMMGGWRVSAPLTANEEEYYRSLARREYELLREMPGMVPTDC